MDFKKQAKKLNSGEVYDLLKGELIKLEFRPGQILSEKEIILKFKLSRTPVRNALSKMERDGIIEIIPRKGAFIKFLSIKDVVEIFEVRKALEGLAARLASRNVDLEELDKFEKFYLDRLQNIQNENPQEVSDFGIRFHEFIINCAANHRIKNILEGLRVQLEICRIFFLHQDSKVQPSRTIQSIKEHLEIIEALKSGNEELAEARMRDHIANAEKHTLTFG
jgi:DNA-binding GntR family transcriptional regulator